MSRWQRDRVLYRLYTDTVLLEQYLSDPSSALSEFDLDSAERAMIENGDVAALYRAGVHPNLIRNFSATIGIDYVESYRRAGLRDD